MTDRLSVLDRLIASGWSDTPQPMIPPFVLEFAASGELVPRPKDALTDRQSMRIRNAVPRRGRPRKRPLAIPCEPAPCLQRRLAFRWGALARCHGAPLVPPVQGYWRPCMAISWRAGWRQMDREMERVSRRLGIADGMTMDPKPRRKR